MTAARDALISAQENRRMFDNIAPRYDLLNALMSLGLHRHWRTLTVRSVTAGGGADFLDLGCGTGDMAIALLRSSPGARVTGVDPSPEMLARAVAKTARAGLTARATYCDGDATALAFRDATFDGVTCAFCLRNVVNHAAALREMRRVLRPGGRAAILELTRPTAPWSVLVHGLYVRRLVPLLGRTLSKGSAYRYLADSIENFPAGGAMAAAMTAAGFAEAHARPLTGGFVTLFTARAPDAARRERR